MQLGFGQVEQLLRHLHRVTGQRNTMLRSRLQHLQKEDLPPGVAIGRGTRFRYDVDAIFMIVVALEFAKARLPAAHVARIVRENWKLIRSLVDEGLEVAALPAAERGRLPSRWALVSADGLSLLRSESSSEEATVESVSDAPGTTIASWAQRLTTPPGSVMVLVDVVGTAVAAADFLRDAFGWNPGEEGKAR